MLVWPQLKIVIFVTQGSLIIKKKLVPMTVCPTNNRHKIRDEGGNFALYQGNIANNDMNVMSFSYVILSNHWKV